MGLLHNMLNSNTVGYISLIVSVGAMVLMETQEEVWDKKSKRKII